MNAKNSLKMLLVICSGCLLLQSQGWAQQPAVPELRFKAETPLELPPDIHFGETAGVAVNSKGHVFVFSRGNSATGPADAPTAAQLLEFDANGKFVREIGKNLYAWAFAHAVRVDKEDNIWAVDKGSSVIVKFNPQGRVTAVFGRKPEASDPIQHTPPSGPAPRHRAGSYNHPTDVAFNSAGDAFISDGYRNSRVAKLNKDGAWVTSWGERGTGPGQFSTPHTIAVDAKDNVYVGDRGNARIQVFDSDGGFLRQFWLDVPDYPMPPGAPNPNPLFLGPRPTRRDDPTVPKAYPVDMPAGLTAMPGAPDAMCVTPGPDQVLYVADVNPSRVYKVSLQGKVLGMIGGPGSKLGQFIAIHALACQSANVIWVGDMLNWRIQKVTVQPQTTTSSAQD